MTVAPCLICAKGTRIPRHNTCDACHASRGPCKNCGHKKPGAVYTLHPRHQLALINRRGQ